MGVMSPWVVSVSDDVALSQVSVGDDVVSPVSVGDDLAPS